MAIFSGIGLSKSKNKLGNLVLMERAGIGVVAREYVADPKNPQTTAQMKRRVKWANLVNFYRLSKGWMSKAFENKAQGQSDYNKLMQLNINASKANLTKEQASLGAVVMQPYVVTYGSIQPVQQRYENGKAISNLSTGALVVTAATTIAELSKALLANNPQLRDGDQISYISYLESFVNAIPYSTCRAFEMPVDTTRTTELISDYLPDFLCHSMEDGGNQVLINDHCPAGGFTWVISRTISGKIYVSTQSLCVDSSVIKFTFESLAAQRRAILSYGESDVNFLDSNSYGETVAAGVPAVITQVFSNNDGDEYNPGSTISVESLEGNWIAVMGEGVDYTSITRIRATTSEGRTFEVGVNRIDEVLGVVSENFPDTMGGSLAYINEISLLVGANVVATAVFTAGEMD